MQLKNSLTYSNVHLWFIDHIDPAGQLDGSIDRQKERGRGREILIIDVVNIYLIKIPHITFLERRKLNKYNKSLTVILHLKQPNT